MTAVTKRNLKIFFRDRSSVFFSILALLIIICLYVVFLNDVIVQDVEGVESGKFLMDSWILAGLLSVASITTTMGAFGITVEDKSRKILKDFYASPLSRRSLAAGYIISAFLIGVIISLIALALGEAYIILNGGTPLSATALVKTLGCILLSVLASSSMAFFLVSFFKSQNVFATASTLIGTLAGFLTGIYIPIGSLPESVQQIVKIFPVSHAGALFRQIIMEVPMRTAFLGAPAETVLEFKKELGVVFEVGGQSISPYTSILILAATTLLFYGLAIMNISRKQK